VLRCAALCCVVQRCAALCCVVLRCAALCCVVLRYAALCCVALCCVVLRCAALCCILLCALRCEFVCCFAPSLLAFNYSRNVLYTPFLLIDSFLFISIHLLGSAKARRDHTSGYIALHAALWCVSARAILAPSGNAHGDS
jgi:hypothetical protein